MFGRTKGAYLKQIVQGGLLYWAFPFSKASLGRYEFDFDEKTIIFIKSVFIFSFMSELFIKHCIIHFSGQHCENFLQL